MTSNYIRFAWRVCKKDWLYTGINIVGLSLSLGVCMLIVLYLMHEYSFDKFHKNANRIFEVNEVVSWPTTDIHTSGLSYSAGPAIRENSPIVESFVRLYGANNGSALMAPGDNRTNMFTETGLGFADSNFFSFFSFDPVEGDLRHALDGPFTMVLTQKAALKYFGGADPMGKTLLYKGQYVFTVMGIVKDPPSNSSIQFSMLGSMSSLARIKDNASDLEMPVVWPGTFRTYVLLHHTRDSSSFNRLLGQLSSANASGFPMKTNFYSGRIWSNHFSPFLGDTSQLKYLTILPLTAALILLLALINYMSLITARATIRAAEVGIRKVLGAGKHNMIHQFYVESTLLVSVAFIVGIVLFLVLKPVFLNLIGYSIDMSFLYSRNIVIAYIVLLLVTAFTAGSYPALVLSAYKPIDTISGKASRAFGGSFIRKTLTVAQFSISACLIICSIIMFRQFEFIRRKDTGMHRDNILMIPFLETMTDYHAFRTDIESLPGVLQSARTTAPLYTNSEMSFVVTNKAKNKSVDFTMFATDSSFISLLGLTWQIPPYSSVALNDPKGVVINHSTVGVFDLPANPIGRSIDLQGEKHTIVGVLKDFNYTSLEKSIGPMGMVITNDTMMSYLTPSRSGCLYLKIGKNAHVSELLERMAKDYATYDKITPFRYMFLDDTFNEAYQTQERLGGLLGILTALTVLIACLGLFGLSAFSAAQRIKEICIRRILGASIPSLVSLLTREFLWLIICALLISSPIAWYIMLHWLQDYAYHVTIGWDIFCITGICILSLGILTVAAQAIKAANYKPAQGLRAE